jgi:hypothetical protein
MALDSAEIRVAGNAHVYVAPVGTAAPTDATTALNAAFIELGYVSEDGITINAGKTTADIMALQSFDPLRTLVTARELTSAFVLRQWNYETLKLALGGGTVTGTSPNYKYLPASAEVIDERAFVFEALDGTVIQRWFFRRVMLSESVSIQFTRTTAADLPITLKALAPTSGTVMEVFFSDANFSAT